MEENKAKSFKDFLSIIEEEKAKEKLSETEIELKAMKITLGMGQESKAWADLLEQGNAYIDDFFILTKSNEILKVSDIEFDVEKTDNETNINITDCKVEGMSNSLEVDEIKQLKFLYWDSSVSNYNIIAKNIDIELARGDEQTKTKIQNQPIGIFVFERGDRNRTLDELSILPSDSLKERLEKLHQKRLKEKLELEKLKERLPKELKKKEKKTPDKGLDR